MDCDPGFHGVFCKTTIIGQLRRWNVLNIEKYEKVQKKKPLEFSFMYGCKCLSACGCVCMRVCVIVTYGYVF